MVPKIRGLEISRLCSPIGHLQQSGKGRYHRDVQDPRVTLEWVVETQDKGSGQETGKRTKSPETEMQSGELSQQRELTEMPLR